MNLHEMLSNKLIKPKEKTILISEKLLNHSIDLNELILYASQAKDSLKATCIEAMEFATKKEPAMATQACLDFVSECLTHKAPRVKWESAKVIGNIAHRFPTHLDTAIQNLLSNADHSGTVVRWSAAYALGEILFTDYAKKIKLIETLKSICEREEKNSIKKIYLAAFKKYEKTL